MGQGEAGISALCDIAERIGPGWKPSGRNNCMHLKASIEAFNIVVVVAVY